MPSQHSSVSAEEFDSDIFMLLELPSEIISLILIRLPVKTLSILKCVSKYFLRLILSSEFIRAHLKFSTEDASMSGYNVVVQEFKYELHQTSLHSLCHESQLNFVKLHCPEKEYYESVRVVGSCNGLVVIIVNREHLFLWNPTIKKHEKLPTIVGHENLYDDRFRFYCGFGFDASNDDYKVVALFTSSKRDSKNVFCYKVNVYSLKRSSWTMIPDFTGGEFVETFGKFASANLHWCTKNGDIVSFNVEREVFGSLELPKNERGHYNLVSVLRGSINVYCDNARLWVMKEYGIKLSWTKMFTISRDDHFGYAIGHSTVPNGQVLIDDDRYFRFYSPKDDSWRSTAIRVDHDPVIYVESLVSPCCK